MIWAQSIWEGNVVEFMAYAFYMKPVSALDPVFRRAIAVYVGRVEAAWGVHFPPGHNPDISFMLCAPD